MLTLNQFNDIHLFKETVLPFLEKDEVVNNLALGLLIAMKEQPIVMATVTKNEHLLLSILQTSPKQIILSKSEYLSDEEIHLLAKLLDNQLVEIPGLVGEKSLTIKLAKELTNLRKKVPIIKMNQRLYKLDKMEKWPEKNGRLINLEMTNLPLVKEWVYKFCMDIDERMSKNEAEEKAIELIKRGRVFGWEVEGEIVSMANAARPSKSNITINFVYTPLSERKKGYASSCTSAITDFMLKSGFKSTSLYTDLDNPTTNKIYMEIGYKPIIDSIVIYFK